MKGVCTPRVDHQKRTIWKNGVGALRKVGLDLWVVTEEDRERAKGTVEENPTGCVIS
ncbi:hypothetical protein JHK85_001101 [Glycine max]|nr:hypothetical protein JHK85_001101 [Glycine max]